MPIRTKAEEMSMTNWPNFSPDVLEASMLIPFRLIDAEDDWDEIAEQLQAMEWGCGIGTWK